VHKVADKPIPADTGSDGPLESLVLARIASAARPVDKGEIAADLSVFAAAQVPASRWRASVDGAIAALRAAGQVVPRPGGFEATPAGTAAAARYLGIAASTPLSWDKACNVWLVAKALGQRKASAKRLAALATLEGLRAAVLIEAYGLQIKGAATPARLRQALAAVALKRAFGGETAAAVAGKTGLPARASRLLAAQLMEKPRDPGTDRRLVSALAAQACAARGADLPALRAAVLRRAFAVPDRGAPERAERVEAPAAPAASAAKAVPAQRDGSPAARGTPANGASAHGASANGSPAGRRIDLQDVAREVWRLATSLREQGGAKVAHDAPSPTAAAGPLDMPAFASEVRRLAAGEAQGWSGDRKAYISRVWRTVREQRPEWGLSEIEFKCMLAEAHRSGQLALANADLKDQSNIKDVQDSAVIYRNAVFHFIRVDA
jgi:hypothetical protein